MNMIKGEDELSLSQNISYINGIALRHLCHREAVRVIRMSHPLPRLYRLTSSYELDVISRYESESLYDYVIYHSRGEDTAKRLSESFEYYLRDEEKDTSFYTGKSRKDTILKERRILS